jgi:raffinose/stachyose/melibiose transport system substrate-binding protein
VLAAAAAGVVLLATGCAPPGASDGPAAAAPTEVSTEAPSEDVTLTLTHFENGGLGESIDRLIEAYESENPSVTIESRYTTFVDYGRSIRLTMASDSAPDIAQVGQAYVMQGPLVEAGLLLPLDDYAEAYGWDEEFQEGLLAQSRFQPDGRAFGEGDLYGVALGGNMVGVYYNRALVEQLGLQVPFATLDEFEAALATAKGAGIQPIALGNVEGWPAGHLVSSLMSQYQEDGEVVDWVFGREGASFESAGAVDALTTVQEWTEAGYISEESNGTSLPDAVTSFVEGESLFFVSGNWSAAEVDEGLGEDAGFMLFPPAEAGAPKRATGATTSPFGISTASENPDVAAHFLDYMLSDEAVDILVEGGYAPVTPGGLEQAAGVEGVRGEFNQAFAEVLAEDGLDLYLDWSTVTMNDTLFPAVQQLIGRQSTPEDVVEVVQADWDTARAS